MHVPPEGAPGPLPLARPPPEGGKRRTGGPFPGHREERSARPRGLAGMPVMMMMMRMRMRMVMGVVVVMVKVIAQRIFRRQSPSFLAMLMFPLAYLLRTGAYALL